MLIDQLLAEPPQNHIASAWHEALTRAKECGGIVEADNVYNYFFEAQDQNWTLSDFPNLRPPFPDMWIEGHRPARILTAKGELDPKARFPLKRWGAILAAVGPEDDPCSEVGASIVVEHLDGFLDIGFGEVRFSLDQEGNPILTDGCVRMRVHPNEGEVESELAAETQLLLDPILLTVSFMNCKNVQRVHNEPPVRLNRRRVKDGKRPLVRYKTLVIRPMAEVLRREGGSEVTGLKQALHIARGHFKNYSADRPLFGRVAGRFWWPSHVRGSASEGEVKKRYRVELSAP